MNDKPPDVTNTSFGLKMPKVGLNFGQDNDVYSWTPTYFTEETPSQNNSNTNWFFTPLGGANTKSPFEISLNGLSGLAGLVGSIYSTNKQVGVMKDQIRSNENIARANYANTISDAAYNRTNYANMVNGWGNQEFTNQTAQNALNSFNSLTTAANNLGISGDTLAAQKQQVKSLMG